MPKFLFRWNQRFPVIRLIGVINLFLGVMAGFSALLSVLIVAIHANPYPERFICFALLLTATAATGLASGVKLFREKPAGPVTFLFGLLLTIFVVTDVVLAHAFPLRLALVMTYGVAICAISLRDRVAMQRFRQREIDRTQSIRQRHENDFPNADAIRKGL